MTKKINIGLTNPGSVGTINKWYKSGPVEILNNTGTSPIRVDKLMIQVSHYTVGTAPWVVGYLVHLTDEMGFDLSGSITSGTTDDTALQSLLNQWKDNVFMTDFALDGPGSGTPLLEMRQLEANTKRILNPGQRLYLTVIVQPLAAETAKTSNHYYDSIVWYSAAAQ